MKLAIAELKRLAASILRESEQSRFRVYIDGHKDWSDFPAACSPQTILTLIERLETLEAERKGTVRLTLEQARELEWAGCSACADEGTSCLWCEEPHSAGHDSRCWLAAAIREADHEQTD